MAANPLVGRWELERYELTPIAGGPSTFPLGEDALGRITYAEDGHMSVFLMAAERPQIPGRGVHIPPEQKAAAYESFIAYAGTYELRGDTVVHHLDFSSVPIWTGGDQERHVAFEDGRLVLTLPVTSGGIEQVYRLVWRREA
jgi:hypothetical protein